MTTKTYENRWIYGFGLSKEEASLDFMNNFLLQFPNKKCSLKMFIRTPPEYYMEKDMLTKKEHHRFGMRFSFLVEEEFSDDIFTGVCIDG